MVNPLNQIIVRCPRNGTTHARITAFSNSLMVEYGTIIPALVMPFIPSGARETLRFAEHPELMPIYDGYSWDTADLHDFIVYMGTIDFETTAEQQPEAALAAQA
jgi:hypothetical protein